MNTDKSVLLFLLPQAPKSLEMLDTAFTMDSFTLIFFFFNAALKS